MYGGAKSITKFHNSDHMIQEGTCQIEHLMSPLLQDLYQQTCKVMTYGKRKPPRKSHDSFTR